MNRAQITFATFEISTSRGREHFVFIDGEVCERRASGPRLKRAARARIGECG